MTAYSMASVCTAMLYPSSGDFEDTAFDSVRNIKYVFPLTNDAMVGDPAFAVSWKADEIYSFVVGNNDVPTATLSLATSRGIDHVAYEARPCGRRCGRGHYLESTKFVDIIETFGVTYYKNDEGLEQASPYYCDIGAYLSGDSFGPTCA
ncbi:hypothetical protein AAK967_06325 [Atopobiaceae bacterium 24-176]